MADANRAREAMGLPTDTAQPSQRDVVISERTHQLERMIPQFQKAMPTGLEAQQITRDVVTALRQNEDLWKCTPASLFGAAMTAAQLGLRVGVLGHGWLIPYERRKLGITEAQWVLGYQGMIELVNRTGTVANLSGHAIHANEKWKITYGSSESIEHEPIFNGNRGDEIIYYTQAWFTNGGYLFKAMSRDELLELRGTIGSARRFDSPWQTQFRAMGLKTCLRRMFTFMPKTSTLAMAIESDGVTRTDLDQEAVFQVPTPPDAEPVNGTPEPDGQQPPDPDRETVTVTPPARKKQTPSRARAALLKAAQDKHGDNLAAVLVQELGITGITSDVIVEGTQAIDYVTNEELRAALGVEPKEPEPDDPDRPLTDEEQEAQIQAAYEAEHADGQPTE